MPNYSYSYTTYYTPFYMVVLPILAAIVAIVGGLALYFLFTRKPNRFTGAAARLHDILNFRTFFSEHLLRALYSITVVAIAVYSVILLFTQFFTALLLFVLGNLIARIIYEYALLLLVLCRNTQEINRKMGPLPQEPAAPAQPQTPPQAPVPPMQPQIPPQAPIPPVQPQTPPQAPVPPVQPQTPPQAPVPPVQPQDTQPPQG